MDDVSRSVDNGGIEEEDLKEKKRFHVEEDLLSTGHEDEV